MKHESHTLYPSLLFLSLLNVKSELFAEAVIASGFGFDRTRNRFTDDAGTWSPFDISLRRFAETNDFRRAVGAVSDLSVSSFFSCSGLLVVGLRLLGFGAF